MRRSKLSLVIVAVCLGLICSGSVATAQSDTSGTEIQSYRQKMFEISSYYAQIGVNLGNPRVRELAGGLESAVARLSDEDIGMLISLGADPSELAAAAATLNELLAAEAGPTRSAPLVGTRAGRSSAPSLAGFPDAPYNATCPPPRTNTLALQIAINALHVARAALAVAQRGCDLVVVVCPAPGGGNPQTFICQPLDIALDLAQAVVENFQFCDADIDSAEILGSYNRLAHLHGDLETHDADIKSDLSAHDLNIDSDLIAHDLNIDSDLIAHDLKISTQLATHDADIKALLGNIQATVDENQRLIKISMARQLEAMRLAITPAGRREIDQDVLDCTGNDCPERPSFQLCPNGSLRWNCR